MSKEIPRYTTQELNKLIPDYGIDGRKKIKKYTQFIYSGDVSSDALKNAPDGTIVYDENRQSFMVRVSNNWVGIQLTTSTSTSSTSTSTTA